MAPTNLDIDPIFLEAIENLPDGISVFDRNGVPLLHNRMSESRFPHLYEAFAKGAKHYKEAIAYSVRMSRPDFTEDQVADQVQRFNDFTDTGETYEVKTSDGRIVQNTYRPMSDGRKVAISVDVTELRMREKELKKAQAQAVAASSAKSAFLANVSHEIRTPLNGILGMAQVLEMADLTPEQKEQVATILDSGRNLMALLNDVLDLSKIEAGKIAIAPTDTDIAIKFTTSGRIDMFISSHRRSDGQHVVKVRVSDTGVGMDEETTARLFKPFVQADDSTQRKFGGAGLGLSITRKLAELMGGDAVVVSEPGRGSEFSFTFLAGEAQAHHRITSAGLDPAADQKARTSFKGQGLCLLLVDDHPINRQIASLFLKPFEMHIVEAANSSEALAALDAEPFDLILLDIHMPVMDGPTTVRTIRTSAESWRTIPVVALTADAMSGDKERYLKLGMNGYLSKPLAERDLIAEIARIRALTPDQLNLVAQPESGAAAA